MKYLLFIVILLFSCQEKEECKTCKTIVTQSGGGFASDKVVSTSTFGACGNDLKTVDGQVTTVHSNGFTIVSKTTCN